MTEGKITASKKRKSGFQKRGNYHSTKKPTGPRPTSKPAKPAEKKK